MAPKQTEGKWFTDSTERFDFEFIPRSGLVVCRNCPEGPAWCEHIQVAMSDNSDQAAIWDKDPATEYQHTVALTIPMFPTVNLWTSVTLVKTDFAIPTYKVKWTQFDNAFICFLNPGEGRNVIRLVLIQKMQSELDPKKECEASYHGLAAQRQWEGAFTHPSGRAFWMQQWAIYNTGKCLWCLEHDPMSTPDDLAPAKEKTVW